MKPMSNKSIVFTVGPHELEAQHHASFWWVLNQKGQLCVWHMLKEYPIRQATIFRNGGRGKVSVNITPDDIAVAKQMIGD